MQNMSRRQFLLASACAAAAGCGQGPVPFGGSPQAPNTDAERIQDDIRWRALDPRVHSRDWVSPEATRTVPTPPMDFTAAVPELAERTRAAVLLHPRYSDEPAADGSKLGGTFLWPAEEEWPVCCDHPALRLVPILQLRADEFPEIEFRAGTDMLQLLWCPREHERCWARPVLFWRKRAAVGKSLPAMPADTAAYPGYVPLPCRLFPERVTDLPDRFEIGTLLEKLEDWNTRTRTFPDRRMEDVYAVSVPHGGWKIGGYANWIQAPEVPVCQAGHTMELLLSCCSERMNLSQAPVQEEHLYADPARRDAAAAENAANAPRLRFIGDGVQFTFLCRRCPNWPVETISQC